LTLALIRPEFLAVESDEPHIFLPHHQITRARRTQDEGRNPGVVMNLRSSHEILIFDRSRVDANALVIAWFRRFEVFYG
jgi:hypothetical protein